MMEKFEIQWRKELLKRLQTPTNTLNRQFDREQAAKEKRNEELQVYQSPEEAHDAYGYGYITWDEYQQICKDFEAADSVITPVSAARDELKSIMAKLNSDIRYFKWEALSDEEKQAIEKNNEEYRNQFKK